MPAGHNARVNAHALPMTEHEPLPPPAGSRVARALVLSALAHLALVALLSVTLGGGTREAPAPDVLQVALAPAQPGRPAEGDASVPAEALAPAPPREQTPVVDAPPPAQPALAGDTRGTGALTAAAPPPAEVGAAAAIDGLETVFIEQVREAYLDTVAQWLRSRPPWYAPGSPEAQLRGHALVSFALDREGRVLSARISRSSGDPLLDAAALETVRRAAPFPPAPAGLPFAVIDEIYLPVRFRGTVPASR